jgi:hypothetical protein
MADVSLAFNTVGRDRGVNSLLSRTASNVRASSVAAAAGAFALRAGLASAAAAAVALANSAVVASGAVAAIPAAYAGYQAILGAARAVTFGLGDAWTATGQAAKTGGGSVGGAAQKAATAAHAVRDATQSLADAKRDEADATRAVNTAREQEMVRLRDLSVSLAGSRLDEEGATRAVAKAAQDLAVARAGGSNYDIEEADLAYRQSQQTLVETKNRTTDLTKEQQDGAKKGIEGSDAVQGALRQQADAHEQVIRAAQQLADAQQRVETASAKAASGGIDPAAAALAKLSPNGRAVILMLRELAPAWQGAARAGQQATFAGVAGDLKSLSGIYLPSTTAWLTRMGGSFNVAIRQSLGLAGTKDTIRDVGTFTDNTASATDKLARSIKPVINGILQWVTVGSNFLPEFAGWAQKGATIFEQWSIRMRESGKASQWISNGIGVLKQFWAIANNVVFSIVAIVHAGGDGGSTLQFLVTATTKMREFLQSAQGQQKIQAVLATLRNLLANVGQVLTVVAGQGDEFNDALNVTGTVVNFAAGHLGLLAKLLPVIAAGYVLSKTAETGANIAKIVQLPLLAAQVAANWGLRSALTAHTAALTASTAATGGNTAVTEASTVAENTGILAKGRAVVTMVAQKVATVAISVATKAYAAAQWLLNAAMTANPIGLIIAAVIALVAIIVLIATKTTWFQTAWKVAWGGIKSAASAVGSWFKNTLWGSWIKGTWESIQNKGTSVFNWFKTLPGKLKSALLNVGTILLSPYKWAFNQIAGFWNRTVGRLSFTVPSWVPGIGGAGFSMPQIPQLAKGGIVPATAGGRMIIAGEGGEDEAIVPLSKMGQVAGAAGGGTSRVWFDFDGAEREFVRWFRKSVRVDNLLQTN